MSSSSKFLHAEIIAGFKELLNVCSKAISNDSTIKDLSLNLQKEIKDRIKRATDLEVKEVNIRVKNTVDVKPVENKTEKKV